jgi:DnaK suppressor protein
MMKADVRLVQQILEAQLKQANSSKAFGDSIRIQQVADPIDMTQQAAERDLAVQMLDRESALVRRLRSAIDRIKDGSYGVCLQCEEEISPTRLKALPWGELCIRCQERSESLARQRKGIPAFEDQTEAA